jgi:hypothetical protein
LCSSAVAQIASVKVLGKLAFKLSKDRLNRTVQIIFLIVVTDDPSSLRVPKHREPCGHYARQRRWPIVIAPNGKRDRMVPVGSNVLGAIAYAPHHIEMAGAGSPHLLFDSSGTGILQVVLDMERDDARQIAYRRDCLLSLHSCTVGITISVT